MAIGYEQQVKLTVDVKQAIKNVESLTGKIKDLHDFVDKQKKQSLGLDVGELTNKLSTVKTEISNIKSLINDIKDINLNVGSVSISAGIKSITENIKSMNDAIADLEDNRNGTRLKSSFFDMSRDLTGLADTIKDTIEPLLNSLSRKMANNLRANFTAAIEDLKQELHVLTNELVIIERSSLSVSTDQAKANLAELKTQLDSIKNDILQMQSMQLENSGGEGLKKDLEQISAILTKTFTFKIDSKSAETSVVQLRKNLLGIQKLLKQIGETNLNVKITNHGFDDFLKYSMRSFRLMEGIAEKLKNDFIKAKEASGKIVTNAERSKGAFTYLRDALVKGISTLGKNVNTVRRGLSSANQSARSTNELLKSWGGLLLKSFYTLRGIGATFQEIQGFAYNIGQYVTQFTQQIINRLIPAVKSLLSQGFESASKFEDARIAYKLFFPDENPDDIIRTIKTRAIENPVFDATDLSKYVAQLAPLANGDSQLTIDAIEGIAAMLKASGQEVSTYMQRLVTNTQQVVSTGKATARDWNEFLRATPVFEQVIAEVTPSLRSKLNNDNAEITKADTTQLLQALQLIRHDSSISGILEETAKNWSSLVQQIKESIQTRMGEIVVESGLYGMVKNFATEADRLNQILRDTLRPIIDKIVELIATIDLDGIQAIIMDVYHIFKNAFKDILEDFGFDTSRFDITSIRKVINRVVTFITDFIKGWAHGIKEIIAFAKSALQFIGKNPEDFAMVLGQLASPWGNAVSRVLQASAGIGQALANVSSAISAFYNGFKTLTNIPKMTALFDSLNLPSNIYTGGLAKMVNGLTRISLGVGTLFAGSGVNDLLYSINKDWGGLGANLQLASGTAGGIMAGSAFGPFGMVAGGVLGTIVQFFATSNKELERIKENTRITAENTKAAKQKLIARYANTLAEGIIETYNAQAEGKGLEKIDTNTNVGYYAQRRLAKWMEENYEDAENWKTSDLLRLLSQNYTWKKTAEDLDKYVDTAEFRNMGGTKWNPEADSRRVGNVGNIIRNERLLGDFYDYEDTSNQQLVKDFLKGVEWTTEQADAFVSYYQASLSEAEKFQQSVANFENTSGKFLDDYTKLLGESSPLVTALNKLITDGIDVGVNLNQIARDWSRLVPVETEENGKKYTTWIDGNVAPNQNNSENEDNPVEDVWEWLKKGGIVKDIWSGIAGAFNALSGHSASGGLIKPVYRASGGGISSRGVDTVPAMLQPGEFVVRKSVVEKVGLPAMTALNLGDSKLAATLMGRPNVTTNSGGNNYSRNSHDNRKSIRQFIKVVNRNSSATLNSYHSLANRLALG